MNKETIDRIDQELEVLDAELKQAAESFERPRSLVTIGHVDGLRYARQCISKRRELLRKARNRTYG